ncbi:MAG: hypothetical protein R2693_12570 [Nocardioidaceae bacterium]
MLNTRIQSTTRRLLVFVVVMLGFVATDALIASPATARRAAVQFTVVPTLGQAAGFEGQLRTPVARTVILQRRSGYWREVARTKTDSSGAFSLTDPVARSATYRIVAPRWRIAKRKKLRRLVSTSQTFTYDAESAPSPPLTDAMTRAQSWLDARVPYSQSKYYTNQYGRYRTDCSGFVSMVWALSSSYTTRTLPSVSVRIAKEDLAPGDIMNAPGYHAAVFAGWVDDTMTKYWAYEQSGSKNGMVYREVPYPYWNNKSSFVPLRKAPVG